MSADFPNSDQWDRESDDEAKNTRVTMIVMNDPVFGTALPLIFNLVCFTIDFATSKETCDSFIMVLRNLLIYAMETYTCTRVC